MLPSPPQCLQPIARKLDVMALGGEDPLEGGGKAAVVLDDENPGVAHVQRYISRSEDSIRGRVP
jgi:hypothetical protein